MARGGLRPTSRTRTVYGNLVATSLLKHTIVLFLFTLSYLFIHRDRRLCWLSDRSQYLCCLQLSKNLYPYDRIYADFRPDPHIVVYVYRLLSQTPAILLR